MCLGQLMRMIGWRHHLVFIIVEDSVDQFALLEVARNNGAEAVVVRIGTFRDVQTKISFAGALIDAMAIETGIGENGADITIEAEFAENRPAEGQKCEEVFAASKHRHLTHRKWGILR